MTVTGDPNVYPNLTEGHPPGWLTSILTSPEPFTDFSNDVYEGEPIYVDGAIHNDGQAIAPFVTFHVLVDDQFIFADTITWIDENTIT